MKELSRNIANINAIKLVVNSSVSPYQIKKLTDVSVSVIFSLRKNEVNLERITFKNAIALTNYSLTKLHYVEKKDDQVADYELILKLLRSKIKSIDIVRQTGISDSTVYRYRKKVVNVVNISLENALKLTDLFEKYRGHNDDV